MSLTAHLSKEAQVSERAGKSLNRRMDKPETAHVCGARSHETAKLARGRIETVLNLKQLVEGWIPVAILYGRTANGVCSALSDRLTRDIVHLSAGHSALAWSERVGK